MRRHLLTALFMLFAAAPLARSDPPVASYIFPAGGQRGKIVDFRVGGLFLHKSCSFEMVGPGVKASKQLQRTKTLWFEGPLLPLPDSQQAEDYPKDLAGRVEIATDAPLGVRYWQLWNSQGATPAMKFVVGDLPEVVEHEIEGDPVPIEVQLPVTINGRIFPRENVDIWSFQARKGQTVTCEVNAARLGSPLDSRLEVLDPKGRRLAENDDTFGADSFLRFTAPADGKYQVRIHDIAFRGGQAYVYRLTLLGTPREADALCGHSLSKAKVDENRAADPDYYLRLSSDVLAINRGNQGTIKISADRRGGFAGPIGLAIDGLPPGITATGTAIPAQQASTEITFRAESTAAIRAARLTIRGSATIGNTTVTRIAALPSALWGTFQTCPTVGLPIVPRDRVLLAVTLPTPFKIIGEYDMRWTPRGTIHHRRYRIDRGGFQGPIEVSLSDRQARHLQGVTGPTITVPPGMDSFDYSVFLPPWMETGRTSRACVMATGTVKDCDGSEHRVSFSSVEQNLQIIAVVEPARFSIETDISSLLAMPGKTVTIPVHVARGQSLRGPVKLELVLCSHVRGISAQPIVVAADQNNVDLQVNFAEGPLGPFNVPLVIRSTIMDRGEPVVAETKLDIQPAR